MSGIHMTLEQAVDREKAIMRLSNAMEELSKAKIPFYSGLSADDVREIEAVWSSLYVIRRKVQMELVKAMEREAKEGEDHE